MGGVTTQSIEISDIVIPEGLEEAMSRQAQAKRERQSRIILGTAETEIAEKFSRHSTVSSSTPPAKRQTCPRTRVALQNRPNDLVTGLATHRGDTIWNL